jgi:hypothetical protein
LYPTDDVELEETNVYSDSTGTSLVPPPPPGSNVRRRHSFRGGNALRQQKARRPSVGQGQPQIQLLSIPQLDAIQRSLKLLDVRLQHVQSNARDDERSRDDINHIRTVMSENQKALHTIVTVLSSIQEEVRVLSITMHKQQQNTLQIQAPRKKSNDSRVNNANDERDRSSPLARLELSNV